jgi:GDPmannose 4,6-dehydratase
MRALITGVAGQDGFYLAQQLLKDGHQVYGMVRGRPGPVRDQLQDDLPDLRIVEGDLLDQSGLQTLIGQVEPDVIYNLGALTFVGMSWTQPTLMTEVTGLGVLRLLEAVRAVNSGIRVVHASSSEMYGAVRETPQDELTPLNPRSPYGVAKAFAHHTCINYRDSYNMHVSTAIMFNHESPRRGYEFVTQKVARAAAQALRVSPRAHVVNLGALDPRRDWGWAPEYMAALPLIAAQPDPSDFCLATGVTHSVRELCETAFGLVGLDWKDHVVSKQSLYRPADVDLLQGDARRAKRILGWEPTVTFHEIIDRLVQANLERLAQ